MALSVNPPNSVIHDTVSLKHMLWFCCFWRSGVAQASVYGGARRWLLLVLLDLMPEEQLRKFAIVPDFRGHRVYIFEAGHFTSVLNAGKGTESNY